MPTELNSAQTHVDDAPTIRADFSNWQVANEEQEAQAHPQESGSSGPPSEADPNLSDLATPERSTPAPAINQAGFEKAKMEFAAIQSTETINYVLQKMVENSTSSEDPFSNIKPEELAALLIKIDESNLQALEQVTNGAEIKPEELIQNGINSELVDKLRVKVSMDEEASRYYLQPKINEIAKILIQEPEKINPDELFSTHELLQTFGYFHEDIQLSPELQNHIKLINEECEKRKIELEGVAKTIAESSATTGIPIPEGSSISSLEKNETNDTLVVTTTAPDGKESQTEVKKPDLLMLMMFMVVADTITGSHYAEETMQLLLNKTVVAPLLEKFGIDPETILQGMGADQDKFAITDEMIRGWDNDAAKKFFTTCVKNHTVFRFISQFRPEHRKMIFATPHTMPFKAGIFDQEITLEQELVETMRKQLKNEGRLAELGIEEQKPIA